MIGTGTAETPIETIKRLQDQAAEYNVGADRALDDLWEGLGTKREAPLWQRVNDLLTLSGDAGLQLRKAVREAQEPRARHHHLTGRDHRSWKTHQSGPHGYAGAIPAWTTAGRCWQVAGSG